MTETYYNSNANVEGVVDERYGSKVVHYRGIKYGRIVERFADTQLVHLDRNTRLKALKYGFVLH